MLSPYSLMFRVVEVPVGFVFRFRSCFYYRVSFECLSPIQMLNFQKVFMPYLEFFIVTVQSKPTKEGIFYCICLRAKTRMTLALLKHLLKRAGLGHASCRYISRSLRVNVAIGKHPSRVIGVLPSPYTGFLGFSKNSPWLDF
jgi:hypothetical protein